VRARPNREPAGQTLEWTEPPYPSPIASPVGFSALMNIIYFDLETQRTANDVGGWVRKRDMGMSLGVTYSTILSEYRIFPENRVNDLIQQLMRADLVVGFNIVSFDYEVLMGYTILDLPHQLRTLDLFLEIEKVAGNKLKLDNIAQATLGVAKTAGGVDAIKWWREKRVMDIAEYCCFDVKVTKLVHEHGMEHRELFYTDKFSRKQRVEIKW
jgi:RNase_H superfamily